MGAERGRHVLLIGLEVRDHALYARYRAGMQPILARYGGAFGFDLAVERALKSPGSEPINRAFSIVFPDRAAREAFFADADYCAVRAACFEPSVASTTWLGEYDEPST